MPMTVRQFNHWSRGDLPSTLQPLVPEFNRNANDTLRRHRELHASVAQTIATIRARRIRLASKRSPLETLAGLRRRIAEAQLIADISKRELKVALEESEVLRDHLAAALRARDALEREVGTALAAADAKLDALNARNAELVALVAKVSGIRAS
jgi:hypothetical protein